MDCVRWSTLSDAKNAAGKIILYPQAQQAFAQIDPAQMNTYHFLSL
jgi:hypothetical protein